MRAKAETPAELPPVITGCLTFIANTWASRPRLYACARFAG